MASAAPASTADAPPKHQCKLCDYSFSRNEHLVRHMLTIHNQGAPRQFVCDICKAAFNRSDLLKRHDDNVHIARDEGTRNPIGRRSARVSTSCKQCALSKCKCDLERPCKPCRSRNVPCEPQDPKPSKSAARQLYVTSKFSYGIKQDWRAPPSQSTPNTHDHYYDTRLPPLAALAPAAAANPRFDAPGVGVYQPFVANVTTAAAEVPDFARQRDVASRPLAERIAAPMSAVLQGMDTARTDKRAPIAASAPPLAPASLKRKASDQSRAESGPRPIAQMLAGMDSAAAPQRPVENLAPVKRPTQPPKGSTPHAQRKSPKEVLPVQQHMQSTSKPVLASKQPSQPAQGKSLWEVLLESSAEGT